MEKRHGKQSSLTRSILIGSALALGLGAVLTLLVAALLLRASDPTAYLRLGGLGCLAATAFALGWFTVRAWGRQSLLPALLTGGVFAILVAVGGLAVPGSTLPVAVRCIGVPAVFLLALLGGTLAGRRRRRRRRR